MRHDLWSCILLHALLNAPAALVRKELAPICLHDAAASPRIGTWPRSRPKAVASIVCNALRVDTRRLHAAVRGRVGPGRRRARPAHRRAVAATTQASWQLTPASADGLEVSA